MVQNNLNVSVVIPSFNSEKFVCEAVDSALEIGEPVIEVIVVDDSSQDKTREILKGYGGKVKTIYLNENRGGGFARNIGINAASGNLIQFLDSDDRLLREDFTNRQKALHAYPLEKKIYYSNFLNISESGDPLARNWSPPTAISSDIGKVLSIATPLSLYPRTWLQEIGGFDPYLRSSQEGELNLRLLLAGYKFVYTPGNVVEIRSHSSPDRIGNSVYEKFPLSRLQAGIQMLQIARNLPLCEKRSLDINIRSLWLGTARNLFARGDVSSAMAYIYAANALCTRPSSFKQKIYFSVARSGLMPFLESLTREGKKIVKKLRNR